MTTRFPVSVSAIARERHLREAVASVSFSRATATPLNRVFAARP